MAQWIKTLAIKPSHLSSIPQTHMAERKKELLKVVLLTSNLHTLHWGMHHVGMYTYKCK